MANLNAGLYLNELCLFRQPVKRVVLCDGQIRKLRGEHYGFVVFCAVFHVE